MDYLLIVSGYENQESFWERLSLNIPSIINCKLEIVYCEDLVHGQLFGKSTENLEEWYSSVLTIAKKFKIDVARSKKWIVTQEELKRNLISTNCVVFSHNILAEVNNKGLMSSIKGSILSFDSHFETTQHCIIVFDKKVKSIENFKNFFNHFAKSMSNTEVILLMEIGKTLNEASKNKNAVSYVVSLFKSVGVITYPPEEMKKEIIRYISLKKNTVLIVHKSNYSTLMESRFKENLQNRKIAYYLDEF